ncbi:MAG: thiol peroxidase [Candidatus Thioglobus sp.]|nr:MAG: thiol peroxidase [Candidatus Thioglobus sp.]|tara:strand:- start:2251 stop:2751 length:501 start_codon:yes stop_codon:yes gene_type:complete
MAAITLQGNPIHTNADLPAVGEQAPDFKLVDKDLNDVSLANFVGKKKIISIVPSLDTPVCAVSTKKFADLVATRNDVVVLIVSADLPFAMTRFCSSEGLAEVVTLAMMRNKDFAHDYGVLIEDGPLAGIAARAVLALSSDNQVLHTELVSEIANEPDYDAALAALS